MRYGYKGKVDSLQKKMFKDKVWNTSSANAFAVVTDQHEKVFRDMACFMRLSRNRGELRGSPEYLINMFCDYEKYDGVPKEIEIAWTEYMTQASYYSKIFVPQSTKTIMKRKSVVADCDTPHNILLGGLQMSRFSHEGNIGDYRQHCITWFDLVKAGLNPDLAYVVSLRIKGSEKNGLRLVNRGHILLSGASDNQMHNFLLRRTGYECETYKKSNTYDSLDILWNKERQGAVPEYYTIISRAIKDAPLKDKKKSTNPFEPVPTSRIDYKPAIGLLVERLNAVI